jgi:Caspase domain
MRKLLIASLLLCVALAPLPRTRSGLASSPAGAPFLDEDRRSPFVLELPEAGGQPITAPEASIPTHELTRITLRVLKPYADGINYSRIHTKINGESADTIFNYGSDLRGYVIRGDLAVWPRFKLRPGKNVVEISATDRGGKSYYASYVLLAGRAGGGGVAAGASLESVPLEAGPDRQPPEVRLAEPKGSVRVGAGTGRVRVVGVAFDNSGMVASVSVNGQPARLTPAAGARGLSINLGGLDSGLTPEAAKGAVAFEQAVAVGPSTPAIVVEAKDGAGNLTRLTIPVRRREAAVSPAFRGRKFALIVGVSRYKYHDGGIGDLAYADSDARALRDFLQSPEGGGFSPSDILFLENEQATVEALRGALTEFLPRAGPGDLLLLFIAGHGAPDPYAPQQLYFILHDTKLADMPHTALPMDELKKVLDQRVRAERLVVFVDTCHSAGLSGEKLVAARGIENNLINLYASRLYTEAGRAVITSSDVNEVSQESTRWGGGHGVFTWALLEGLGGDADANGDHYVTAGELFDYVRDRVRVETSFRQNPRALPGLNADLALSFVRGK